MSMLDPEHSHRNQPEGTVAGGALVVAGGEGAELLAAVDRALDAVAQPVHGAVERPGAALGALTGDGVAERPTRSARASVSSELREPTDFSIVAEWRGFPRDPTTCQLGLGWERAIAAFDLRPWSDDDLRAHCHPASTSGPLLGEASSFFGAEAGGTSLASGRFATLIVTAGEGAGGPVRRATDPRRDHAGG